MTPASAWRVVGPSVAYGERPCRSGQLSRSTATRCRTKRDPRSALLMREGTLQEVDVGNDVLGTGWAKSSWTTRLGELLSNASYEVTPLRTAEDVVLASVP